MLVHIINIGRRKACGFLDHKLMHLFLAPKCVLGKHYEVAVTKIHTVCYICQFTEKCMLGYERGFDLFRHEDLLKYLSLSKPNTKVPYVVEYVDSAEDFKKSVNPSFPHGNLSWS